MIGHCPICQRVLMPMLQVGRDGAPALGDLTVCACRSLLEVAGVSPVPEPVYDPESDRRRVLYRVAFRRAPRSVASDPTVARLMDEARLAADAMPGDKFQR